MLLGCGAIHLSGVMQWGWQHKYALQELADDMLCSLAAKYNLQLPPVLAQQQQNKANNGSGALAASAPVAAAV